jgi:D-ornithine/D-lysine decarboxylase
MSSRIVTSPLAWSIPGYLEARTGRLAINGVDSEELVSRFDSPLFVFSEQRIRHNIERLKEAAKEVTLPVRYFYASKANSNMAVLNVVKNSGIDIEVNSGGELFKALRLGFAPEQIIFNGTSKTDEELDEAVRAGIYSINVDSIFEIDLIEEAARRVGKRARVALRLVPEIGTRSHLGLQTALLTSKFGISSTEVLDAFYRALKNPDLIHVSGIHIHVGSQTPDLAHLLPLSKPCGSTWSESIKRPAISLST